MVADPGLSVVHVQSRIQYRGQTIGGPCAALFFDAEVMPRPAAMQPVCTSNDRIPQSRRCPSDSLPVGCASFDMSLQQTRVALCCSATTSTAAATPARRQRLQLCRRHLRRQRPGRGRPERRWRLSRQLRCSRRRRRRRRRGPWAASPGPPLQVGAQARQGGLS
jgi:hypothetical protein